MCLNIRNQTVYIYAIEMRQELLGILISYDVENARDKSSCRLVGTAHLISHPMLSHAFFMQATCISRDHCSTDDDEKNQVLTLCPLVTNPLLSFSVPLLSSWFFSTLSHLSPHIVWQSQPFKNPSIPGPDA